MTDAIKAGVLSVVISITIPTLVVASEWGSYQANQEVIIEKLNKFDKKLDKFDEKLDETREDVAVLKSKSS